MLNDINKKKLLANFLITAFSFFSGLIVKTFILYIIKLVGLYTRYAFC